VTLQDLLNAEVDLPALAQRGWSWWVDELSAMAPAQWRARLSSEPRVFAERSSSGEWRFWKDGRAMGRAPPRGGAETRVALLLSPDAVLEQETATPRMPMRDLRRMMGFDIDSLSPLAPELIHFDFEVVDRDLGDGRQRVRIGIVTREAAAILFEAAFAQGLTPARLGVRVDGDGPTSVRYDFLPAVMEATGRPTKGRAVRYWIAAAIALFVLNAGTLVVRDIAETARLQALVDAKTPIVNAALAVRRRVEAEERQRADLLARGARADPLRMMSDVTMALPQGAWVRRLEWNGQTLHLVGFRRRDVDVSAALRSSGAFANTRSQTPEAVPGSIEYPFDVVTEWRPVNRP
jgi:general secretion pathway protein L